MSIICILYLFNAIALALTGGQVADISVTPELLEERNNRDIIADKGYDSNALVAMIESNDNIAVIPLRSNRKTPHEYDRHIYKERHLIESFFSKIKEFRKIATSYDK